MPACCLKRKDPLARAAIDSGIAQKRGQKLARRDAERIDYLVMGVTESWTAAYSRHASKSRGQNLWEPKLHNFCAISRRLSFFIVIRLGMAARSAIRLFLGAATFFGHSAETMKLS